MGSSYISVEAIERRLEEAIRAEFPNREVTVTFEVNRSPRLIHATVDGVQETQETWSIEESFSTMVFELAGRIRPRLPVKELLPDGDTPRLTT